MKEWILYAFSGGKVEKYAVFSDCGDYRGEALCAAALKESEEQTEENRNAAKVFRAFVAEKTIVKRADFKRVMRALRHFDEVGLSNDIYGAIEEINDGEDVGAVAFAGTEEGLTGAVERDLSAYKI